MKNNISIIERLFLGLGWLSYLIYSIVGSHYLYFIACYFGVGLITALNGKIFQNEKFYYKLIFAWFLGLYSQNVKNWILDKKIK